MNTVKILIIATILICTSNATAGDQQAKKKGADDKEKKEMVPHPHRRHPDPNFIALPVQPSFHAGTAPMRGSNSGFLGRLMSGQRGARDSGLSEEEQIATAIQLAAKDELPSTEGMSDNDLVFHEELSAFVSVASVRIIARKKAKEEANKNSNTSSSSSRAFAPVPPITAKKFPQPEPGIFSDEQLQRNMFKEFEEKKKLADAKKAAEEKAKAMADKKKEADQKVAAQSEPPHRLITVYTDESRTCVAAVLRVPLTATLADLWKEEDLMKYKMTTHGYGATKLRVIKDRMVVSADDIPEYVYGNDLGLPQNAEQRRKETVDSLPTTQWMGMTNAELVLAADPVVRFQHELNMLIEGRAFNERLAQESKEKRESTEKLAATVQSIGQNTSAAATACALAAAADLPHATIQRTNSQPPARATTPDCLPITNSDYMATWQKNAHLIQPHQRQMIATALAAKTTSDADKAKTVDFALKSLLNAELPALQSADDSSSGSDAELDQSVSELTHAIQLDEKARDDARQKDFTTASFFSSTNS